MVENDGAAVAESLYGVGRDCRDFAYLHLINGFGGGIADGRLFRGHRGNADEFGGIWTVAGLAPPLPELRIARTAGGAATLGAALMPPLQRAFFA